ncbi:MAG: ATP-grasp domain-containing protein [Candidatus Aenigmatarchaeota archaeon]
MNDDDSHLQVLKNENGYEKILNFLKKKNIKLIGITYSKAERYFFPTEEAYLSEQEVFERAQYLEKILQSMGFETKLYPGDEKLFQNISADQPDLILNLVDSVRGLEFLGTCIPASLDLTQIPYTGSGMFALVLSSNKALMKEILIENNIPTPKYQLVKKVKEPLSKKLRFPLITKLNNYNGGVGLTNDAVSDNEQHLRKRLRFLFKTYKSPVLIEEFIDGRELSVIIVDGDKRSVYIGEKIFKPTKKRKYNFCSFDATWLEEDSYYYKKLDDPKDRRLKRKVIHLSKKVFDLLEMADYAKFDVRISKNGKPYFIDCNPNPALGPAECDCAIGNITKMYGIPFKYILARILKNALKTSKYKNL